MDKWACIFQNYFHSSSNSLIYRKKNADCACLSRKCRRLRLCGAIRLLTERLVVRAHPGALSIWKLWSAYFAIDWKYIYRLVTQIEWHSTPTYQGNIAIDAFQSVWWVPAPNPTSRHQANKTEGSTEISRFKVWSANHYTIDLLPMSINNLLFSLHPRKKRANEGKISPQNPKQSLRTHHLYSLPLWLKIWFLDWLAEYLSYWCNYSTVSMVVGAIFQTVIFSWDKRHSYELSWFQSWWKKNYTPNVGLEPTTLRLRVSCSTDWASRAGGDMCPWLSTSQHRWDREENVQDWKQVRNTAKVWHQNWDWNWSFYMFRAIASLFKGNSSHDVVMHRVITVMIKFY